MGALREFVADLLEAEGAAVDPIEPDALDVLAPEPVRAAMGWPELARLGFGATLPQGATPIGLEGDWLDRFGTLLDERGRLAERQLAGAGPLRPGASLRGADQTTQGPAHRGYRLASRGSHDGDAAVRLGPRAGARAPGLRRPSPSYRLGRTYGQAPCPSCGKAWCRACHGAACPRCERTTAASAKIR